MIKYLLLTIFCSGVYGQSLHHQMISSQGKSAVLPNGTLVKQTIGQQTVSGNSKGQYMIVQGFQQNYWAKMVAGSPLKNDLVVTTYPNPFVAEVNFQFSKPLQEEISVAIFDVSGRLVFQQKKSLKDGFLSIDLSRLAATVYLVRLNNNEVNYYTKITKSL